MFMTLDRKTILSEAEKVKNGTIARVGYKTCVPVKAEFKRQGISITKVVETSARLGVNYYNISEVIKRNSIRDIPPTKKANNYLWIIRNKVRYNTSTDKYYLYIASFNKGHNTKSYYIVDIKGCLFTFSKDEFMNTKYRHYVIDSYWKRSDAGSEVRNIAFENIFRINSVGHTIDQAVKENCIKIE